MKARAAVNGFVAEGSAYETEKKTGRGKRKRVRNRLFEDTDTDFDKDIIKRRKKSIPAPPSIPFKSMQIKKNITQKSEPELNNRLPMASCSSTKVSHMLI